MVNDDVEKKTLAEIEVLTQQLYSKMKAIGYASEEFWRFHDELVPLLIHGITEARKQHNEVMAQKFEDLREDVKDNTPSGYWK